MEALRRLAKSGVGLATRLLRAVTPRAPGLAVFCFHDVTDTPSEWARTYNLATPVDLFRRQISWIAEHFEIIHPRDLVRGAALPRPAALLTFDDGFAGSFAHGIRWLAERRLPSVMFLNMRTVQERRPMVSAVTAYLEHKTQEFVPFATSIGLAPPYHLSATPSALQRFEERFGPIPDDPILAYQGRIASLDVIQEWSDESIVVYGNHLFDHWNAAALQRDELEESFIRNQAAIQQLPNGSALFAFPNGQPGTCWTERDVEVVRACGAIRAFAASGAGNRDTAAFLLDRVALGPADDSANRLWFRTRRVYRREPHAS